MIVDPDKLHEYFQKYDTFTRHHSRGLGRTTAYLALLRDHVVNGFMAEKFAFITHSNHTMSYVRNRFLDLIHEWDMTPTRVFLDRVDVNSHTVYFLSQGYASCKLKGVSLNAIFVDAMGVKVDNLIPCISRTGKIYGYE